jgi:tetratricopeptide (TPR) repeat protein
LAEILLTRGSIVEALEVLRPLAEQSPGSEGSLEARLLTLSVGGEEELPALYRLVGENLHLARAYLALGLARHRTSGGRAAILPLRIALEIEDQDPVPWLMLREVTPEEDSIGYPEPLPDLRGRLEHARRLFDVGDTGGGQEIVGAILDQRPHHVPAHLVPVLDAEAREDPWVALAGYRRLADWLPEIPSLQARAARIAHTMEAEELATCLARRAMQSMPEEPSLHYLLAAIHSEAGEWEAASTACRRAIELGMEEAPLYLTLGRVEFEQMHIGESIDAYAKAVELDPDADRAVPRFALATLSTEEFDALRDLMEIELQRDPKGENTLYTLGLMSLRDNDFAAAVEYFERLSSLLPEDTQVQHHLGTAYMRAGDKEKGKAALERFRELKAAEEEAWVEHNQAYAKKLQAQDATAAGERDEALRIYNELASAGFAEPDDYLAAGALYLEAEDYERAYGWFEQFLNANPYKREALEGLAEAAAGLGSTEVAIEARARADLLSWPCTVDP